MSKMTEFRFDCPAPKCDEPWAHTVEDTVDVHGGAVFTCAFCGSKIVIAVFTLEAWLEQSEDDLASSSEDATGLRQLNGDV